jgi:hypothetical protein
MNSMGQRVGEGVVLKSTGVSHGAVMAVNMKRQAPAKTEVE